MLRSRLSLTLAAALACAGAAQADIWHLGDLTTYGEGIWGGIPGVDGGATLLVASFDSVYAGTGGVITGSITGSTMIFTDPFSVLTYLPSIGPYAPLNGSVLNPITTAAGAFGGDVLALEFNVDFSDAGLLPGASGIRFGDLVLENFSTLPVLNGLTVRQYLADMNKLLSGGSTAFAIADIGTTLGDLNASFSSGNPLAFAQEHLVAPASPASVPEPSSWLLLITAMTGWGGMLALRRERSDRSLSGFAQPDHELPSRPSERFTQRSPALAPR